MAGRFRRRLAGFGGNLSWNQADPGSARPRGRPGMGDQPGPPDAGAPVARRSNPGGAAAAGWPARAAFARSPGTEPRARSRRHGPERRADLEYGHFQILAS